MTGHRQEYASVPHTDAITHVPLLLIGPVHLHLDPDAPVAPIEGSHTATVRYNLDIPAVSIGGAAGPQAHEELLRSIFGSVD